MVRTQRVIGATLVVALATSKQELVAPHNGLDQRSVRQQPQSCSDTHLPAVAGDEVERFEGDDNRGVAVRYAVAPKMYAWSLPRIARQLDRGPGVLLSIGMTNRPVRSGPPSRCGVRCPKCCGSATTTRRTAPSSGAHVSTGGSTRMFGRFRVLSVDGAWRGRTFHGPLR
jgi:hypothetical protein